MDPKQCPNPKTLNPETLNPIYTETKFATRFKELIGADGVFYTSGCFETLARLQPSRVVAVHEDLVRHTSGRRVVIAPRASFHATTLPISISANHPYLAGCRHAWVLSLGVRIGAASIAADLLLPLASVSTDPWLPVATLVDPCELLLQSQKQRVETDLCSDADSDSSLGDPDAPEVGSSRADPFVLLMSGGKGLQRKRLSCITPEEIADSRNSHLDGLKRAAVVDRTEQDWAHSVLESVYRKRQARASGSVCLAHARRGLIQARIGTADALNIVHGLSVECIQGL